MKNLFGEGNDVFNEGNWARAVELYAEALGVSEYAESEDIDIPSKTRERLHANRAAAYLHIVSAFFCPSAGCLHCCPLVIKGAVIDLNPVHFLSSASCPFCPVLVHSSGCSVQMSTISRELMTAPFKDHEKKLFQNI